MLMGLLPPLPTGTESVPLLPMPVSHVVRFSSPHVVTDTTCAHERCAPQSTARRALQSLHVDLLPRGTAHVHSL